MLTDQTDEWYEQYFKYKEKTNVYLYNESSAEEIIQVQSKTPVSFKETLIDKYYNVHWYSRYCVQKKFYKNKKDIYLCFGGKNFFQYNEDKTDADKLKLKSSRDFEVYKGQNNACIFLLFIIYLDIFFLAIKGFVWTFLFLLIPFLR